MPGSAAMAACAGRCASRAVKRRTAVGFLHAKFESGGPARPGRGLSPRPESSSTATTQIWGSLTQISPRELGSGFGYPLKVFAIASNPSGFLAHVRSAIRAWHDELETGRQRIREWSIEMPLINPAGILTALASR